MAPGRSPAPEQGQQQSRQSRIMIPESGFDSSRGGANRLGRRMGWNPRSEVPVPALQLFLLPADAGGGIFDDDAGGSEFIANGVGGRKIATSAGLPPFFE